MILNHFLAESVNSRPILLEAVLGSCGKLCGGNKVQLAGKSTQNLVGLSAVKVGDLDVEGPETAVGGCVDVLAADETVHEFEQGIGTRAEGSVA